MKNDDRCYDDMYDKDKRHKNGEVPVSGLMTKGIHAQPGPEASAQNTYDKKRLFRDPPFVFPCLALICSHQNEPCKIHYDQINDEADDQYLTHFLIHDLKAGFCQRSPDLFDLLCISGFHTDL